MTVFKNYAETKNKKPGPLSGLRVSKSARSCSGLQARPSWLGWAPKSSRSSCPCGDVTRSLNPSAGSTRNRGPCSCTSTLTSTTLHWIFTSTWPADLQGALCQVRRGSSSTCGRRHQPLEHRLRGHQEVNPASSTSRRTASASGRYAEEDRPSNDGAAQASRDMPGCPARGQPPLSRASGSATSTGP